MFFTSCNNVIHFSFFSKKSWEQLPKATFILALVIIEFVVLFFQRFFTKEVLTNYLNKRKQIHYTCNGLLE